MTVQSAGLIWMGKGKGGGYRYFKEYRKMRKHKGQERYEVVVKGRKHIVSPDKIKRFPPQEA